MSDKVGLLKMRSDTRIGCSLHALAPREQAGLSFPREGKGEGQHVDGTASNPSLLAGRSSTIPVMEDGNMVGLYWHREGER